MKNRIWKTTETGVRLNQCNMFPANTQDYPAIIKFI